MCCADTLALAESRREFNGCADDCVSSLGVPRTLKEAGCRRPGLLDAVLCRRWRSRVLVAWWPSVAAVQAEAANHRELLRSRVVVVSVTGKSRR
jgi:hypothetical protein